MSHKRKHISDTGSLLSPVYVSPENSTTTASDSFIGLYLYGVQYQNVRTSIYCNVAGKIFIDHSIDGITAVTTTEYVVLAGKGRFDATEIEQPYARVRFVADAPGGATELKLYTKLSKKPAPHPDYTPGDSSVAIGNGAAESNQGSFSVAIGGAAGQTSQSSAAIAIGQKAGRTNQGVQTVAVGTHAGKESQSQSTVAVGSGTGEFTQGVAATALGAYAGQYTQGTYTTAAGRASGKYFQANDAVAIGANAGEGLADGTNFQGDGAIAIGRNAAKNGQPARSIAIGKNCASPGAVGRIAFGNALEAVTATATAGAATLPANPQAFWRLEYNGTLYKIPLYNN